jgi:hypothetical protein
VRPRRAQDLIERRLEVAKRLDAAGALDPAPSRHRCQVDAGRGVRRLTAGDLVGAVVQDDDH